MYLYLTAFTFYPNFVQPGRSSYNSFFHQLGRFSLKPTLSFGGGGLLKVWSNNWNHSWLTQRTYEIPGSKHRSASSKANALLTVLLLWRLHLYLLLFLLYTELTNFLYTSFCLRFCYAKGHIYYKVNIGHCLNKFTRTVNIICIYQIKWKWEVKISMIQLV